MNLAILASTLVILIIPSLLWFMIGRPECDEDAVFGHMVIFVLLGIVLLMPTFITLEGLSIAFTDFGIMWLPQIEDTCSGNSEDCVVSLKGAISLISLGMIVYWIDYIAGVNMHELYHGKS